MSGKWAHPQAPSCRHGWKNDWKKDDSKSWGGGNKGWGGRGSDCGWKPKKSHGCG
jgi:hypothetical protein